MQNGDACSGIPWLLLVGYFLLTNGSAFLMFGWDKRCARLARQRIPEARLLMVAAVWRNAGRKSRPALVPAQDVQAAIQNLPERDRESCRSRCSACSRGWSCRRTVGRARDRTYRHRRLFVRGRRPLLSDHLCRGHGTAGRAPAPGSDDAHPATRPLRGGTARGRLRPGRGPDVGLRRETGAQSAPISSFVPDNTIHAGDGWMVRPRSPLPWLHIAEVVAEDRPPGRPIPGPQFSAPAG